MYSMPHRRVRAVTWRIATAMLVMTAACEDVSVTTVAADRIEIDPATAEIVVDQTVRLTARVLSEAGQVLSGRVVTWTSQQPAIAVVDADGTVRGVAPGTAVIRASSEGMSFDATVDVNPGGVAAVPEIAVAPQALSFSAAQNGSTPGDRTVAVTNKGTGSLTGLSATVRHAASEPTGWLTANLSATTAPATLIVSANQSGLAAGTYSATIDLSAPGVANSPVGVTVSLSVSADPQPAPAIGLGSTSVSFSAVAGEDAEAQAVSITNAGGGTLGGLSAAISYSGEGGGWLTASLSGTTAPTTLTLTATAGSLEPGVYSAIVRVESDQAVNSPQQIQVSFTVASAVPGSPSNLTATAVSSSRIDLAWTASTGPVQQYRIQRRLTLLGTFAQIDSVPAGTTAYLDTSLLPLTGYTYRVEACGQGGCSGWSNEAAATTLLLGGSPGAPGNVAATALSATQVQLSWTAPGGQTSYEIRRRTGTGGQYNFNITVSGEAISYEDSGLTPGTTYQYQVRACVESACSDYTNPVTVNTPPSDGG